MGNNDGGEDKMVGGVVVRSSLSFPNPRFSPLRTWRQNPLRSTSLSCPFHPVVSNLHDELRRLRVWQAAAPPTPSGSPKWIADGLDRLDALLEALSQLLFLPQAQEPLLRHRRTPWADHLLDDFLRLADAHGSFRTALAALKRFQSDAQVALRRNDEPRLASAVRALRHGEKELIRFPAGIRDVGKSPGEEDCGEAEIAGIMRKVRVAAVAASRAVMEGVAAVSGVATSAAGGTGRHGWGIAVLRWSARTKKMSKEREGREREKAAAWRCSALDKMEKLEECIEALESSSGRVFRTLVNTRVSLLNILTPNF